jgi:hypothetical protein
MYVAAATFIRRITMPKARKAEPVTTAAETTPEHTPAITMAGQGATAAAVQEPPAQKAAGQSDYAPDPTPVTSVNLSGTKDGQSMQLLRSHRFKQMQVKFEGAQPDEQYLKMLTDNGWKDRTESEGVFTKQIDQDARWQSVQKMEQEFREVANKIRQDRKLPPVLELVA